NPQPGGRMPVSLFPIDPSFSLTLLLPLVGLAIRSRKKKETGEDDDSLPAYQLLIESYFDGVLSLDSEGIVTWVDDRFLNLMSCGLEGIEGQPFSNLIDPGDIEKVQQYITQALLQPQNFEVRAIDNCGSVLILELSMVTAIDSDDKEILVGVQDISDADALRKRIAFTEKMDLLSRVMGSINTDLEMILEALTPLAEMGEDARIFEMLKRLSELKRRIELFPRRGIRDGADITIRDLLESAVDSIIKETPDSGGRIEMTIADEMFPIFGDQVQLTEAFRNVLRNACQASDETCGGVQVTCSPLAVDRATPRRGFLLPQGEYIHLIISDTGPGIPREILDHVFEPLFSTRPGTPLAGLGLAVTYTVVKNHRGYIEIESTQSEGTTVEIYIPRSRIRQQVAEEPETAEPAAATEEGAVAAAPAVEAGEALVVEDQIPEPVEEAIPEIVEPEPATTEEPAETETEEEVETVEPVEPEPVVEEIQDEPAEAASAVEEADVAEAGVEEEEEEEEEEEILDDTEIASLSGHETILIIEEDNSIRDMIQETITSFGYNGLPARNWVEGVDLFKKHSHLVDLVLLNVLVPEMVWVKTLMDLRRAVPEASVGLMGGDEATETMTRYLAMPGISYIIKPLNTAVLMRGVRNSLDETGKTGD
ncbi:ATP-binding protein, partial [Candidatus Zixiibacteriota bacterium]